MRSTRPRSPPARRSTTPPASPATARTCRASGPRAVADRGRSGATYFQVATGRMPAADNGAQIPRKEPFFTPEEIDQLGAYIQSNGGGPEVPVKARRHQRVPAERRADLAKGAELYRLNCASCHNFTGKGGALSQGKYAPDLGEATDSEIYAAMLVRPGEHAEVLRRPADPGREEVAIITYVQNAKATMDPGRLRLGGFGPVSEGFFAFIVGMGADRRRHAVDGSAGMSGDVDTSRSRPDDETAPRCRGRSWPGSARGSTASSWSSTASATSRAARPTSTPSARSPSGSLLAGLSRCCFVGRVHLVAAGLRDRLLRQAVGVRAVHPAPRAVTLGLTHLAASGIGVVALATKIVPHEVAVQQRHDGHVGRGRPPDPRLPSRRTRSTSRVWSSAAACSRARCCWPAAASAWRPPVPMLGGLIKNPWAEGAKSELWVTPWAPAADGTKVRLTQIDGTPVRPDGHGGRRAW